MRLLRFVTALIASIALAASPAQADQILGPGRIVSGSNAVVLPGGPTLGLWSGGKYIATPDAVRIKGPGSTGDVSGTNVPLADGAIGFLGQTIPALDIARSEIGARVILLRSFVANGFAAAGDAGAGARYVRGTASGFMAIQDAAGTWFQLDISGPTIPAAWVGVVAGDQSKAATNASAINGLMAAVAARGGGEIILPPGRVFAGATIDNAYDFVLIRGSGGVLFANYGTPKYATTIVPTFAGTVLKHRTPDGADHLFNGGGFDNLRVIGNGIATRLLEVRTVWGGTYRMRLEDSVGADAVLMDGTSIASVGAGNIQRADIDLSVSQVAPGAASRANAVVFDGDADGNVSIIDKLRLDLVHANGDGLVLKNADNLSIWQRAYRIPGGTGASVRSKAGATEPVSARGNVWTFFTANTAPVFEGIETAASPSSGVIQYLDRDNGTPLPVLGTHARCPVANVHFQYTPKLTTRDGSVLGAGATADAQWSQDVSGKVTAFVSISLPNGAGVRDVIGFSLPTPMRLYAIEGNVSGKELSVTSKGVSGIVSNGSATFQFSDGTLQGQNGMNFRLKVEYDS